MSALNEPSPSSANDPTATPALSASPAPGPSSPAATATELRLILFPCGQGDTILIQARLGECREACILVDCCLHGRARREAFFKFLDDRGIRRLDLILQTHPDLDHFLGLREVLERFTEDGRSLGYYVDGDYQARQIANAINPSVASEYDRLQDKVDELAVDGRLAVRGFAADAVEWFRLFRGRDDVLIQPLHPTTARRRSELRRQGKTVGQNPEASIDANILAIGAALVASAEGGTFHLFLGSDLDAESVREAVRLWRSLDRVRDDSAFDVVKVPHHGSAGSHTAELVESGRRGGSRPIAAISCGTGRVLPDRRVLTDFFRVWDVLLTTTRRKAAARLSSPLDLTSLRPPAPVDRSEQPLEIRWTPAGCEIVSGERLRAEDLPLFGEARSATPAV